ncbi:PLP-dependent aminotransferase family protein [Geminisphaera colitermitum]|uniref:aminotransferase-like domain-containing protein n=1 Tax=Geminisphaera colitermitum TaxID=1148786 RepID=UPI000158C501|nr:PLP-dependent aminotransferase family protein [Geminisphaera colitermitum]
MPPTSPVLSAAGQRAQSPQITRLMTMALQTPGLLSLAAGFTDNRTLPLAEVCDAIKTLARENAADPEFLQYGTNQGRPTLRRHLAARLLARDSVPATSAVDAAAASIFITNGSQQALYLAMQALCEPGDIVLVDRPSYFVFLELLAGMGVRALSIPVDDTTGLVDGDVLRATLRGLHANGERARLKAVYFVSYFSNPSGRSLTLVEKQTLAAALVAEDCVVPVIEDAAYRDLWFDQPPLVSGILALPDWTPFPRLYLETLTKTFSTGLKTGWGLCTDERWLHAMLHTKGHQDFGTANFNQAICEHALASGAFENHLAVLRPSYAAKMHLLHDTLVAGGLADHGWRWTAPAGGLYLWLTAPDALDTGMDSEFCRACLREAVLYVPGDLCYGDAAPHNHIRLSYGVLSGDALVEAGRRFVRAARNVTGIAKP